MTKEPGWWPEATADCDHFFNLPNGPAYDQIVNRVEARVKTRAKSLVFLQGFHRLDVDDVSQGAITRLLELRKRFRLGLRGSQVPAPCSKNPPAYFDAIIRAECSDQIRSLIANDVGLEEELEPAEEAARNTWEQYRAIAVESVENWIASPNNEDQLRLRWFLWFNLFAPCFEVPSFRTDLKVLGYASGELRPDQIRRELSELFRRCWSGEGGTRPTWTTEEADAPRLRWLRRYLSVLGPTDWVNLAPCAPQRRFEERRPRVPTQHMGVVVARFPHEAPITAQVVSVSRSGLVIQGVVFPRGTELKSIELTTHSKRRTARVAGMVVSEDKAHLVRIVLRPDSRSTEYLEMLDDLT